jgi:uncharacterized membrane protein
MNHQDSVDPFVDEESSALEAPVRPKRSFASLVDRTVLGLARHWLAMLSLFWGLYIGLPLLMNLGWTGPAKLIYTVYRPACHQRPDRSYFLGGPHLIYSSEELAEAGVDVGPFSRDIGNEAVGWKVAFCERDVAIYGALFLGGLIYGLIRRRRGGWLLPFRYYLLFLVPLGIDGVLQLFGLYESTWLLRSLTGILFGFGSVLFAYPYLDDGFAEVRRGLSAKARAG